ncbi:hypothetical protein C8Q80DRAFT_213024 [Daedaleopsis nitida]|nr:hypothetical protein C8Q80DRAFT_213024 [Daedaleopsis nitida]
MVIWARSVGPRPLRTLPPGHLRFAASHFPGQRAVRGHLGAGLSSFPRPARSSRTYSGGCEQSPPRNVRPPTSQKLSNAENTSRRTPFVSPVSSSSRLSSISHGSTLIHGPETRRTRTKTRPSCPDGQRRCARPPSRAVVPACERPCAGSTSILTHSSSVVVGHASRPYLNAQAKLRYLEILRCRSYGARRSPTTRQSFHEAEALTVLSRGSPTSLTYMTGRILALCRLLLS